MKIVKIFSLFMLICIGLFVAYAVFNYQNDIIKSKKELIGEYYLDVANSHIYSNIYKLDSVNFTFNEDMTFSIKMQPPLIRSGYGVWEEEVILYGHFSDKYPLLVNRLSSNSFLLYTYYSLDPNVRRDTFKFVKKR